MRNWVNSCLINFKVASSWLCSLAALGIIIALFATIIAFCIGNDLETVYSKLYTFNTTSELTNDEKNYLETLIKQEKVISISDIQSNIISYYDSFITILATLLGGFALISWFTNKGKIRNEVEDIVQNHLQSKNHEREISESVTAMLAKHLKHILRDEGIINDLRGEITQLVIDEIQKDKDENDKPIQLQENEQNNGN